ncbi:hypothetical protein PV11_04089 [Exophiala sideris]|uniref:BZIP domain-containing protein n=1 Tax=Exophiala sideris TaxID=1016849 RepID=A0A0D1YGH4_9EURO|nr:hypothetical protein PV11_04089 [Exophiala sideris]
MQSLAPIVGLSLHANDQSGQGIAISPRSVAHYTPTQLYRKRAFDRVNQRETRTRKKERVKCLEEENANLNSKIESLQSELLELRAERDQRSEHLRSLSPNNGPRVWEVYPVALPPVTRLDHIMYHFRTRSLAFLQDPMKEIAQTSFPSVVSLLNGRFTEDTPVASIVGEHGPWMQITSSAARTAVMYNICLYLRWLLSRSESTYLALPTHLRPTVMQLTTPHPMWVDIMPWPQGRDQLISHMTWETEQEKFRLLHNETLSVNWPFPLSDILVSDSNNDIALNPSFEAHVRNIENYTIGIQLTDNFPYMDSIPSHPVSQDD